MVKPPQQQWHTPTIPHKLHTPTKNTTIGHSSPMAPLSSSHHLHARRLASTSPHHTQRCRPITLLRAQKRIATFHQDRRMEASWPRPSQPAAAPPLSYPPPAPFKAAATFCPDNHTQGPVRYAGSRCLLPLSIIQKSAGTRRPAGHDTPHSHPTPVVQHDPYGRVGRTVPE